MAASVGTAAPLQGLRARVRAALPAGLDLPEEVWQRRHRLIVALVLGHAAAIFAFALLMDFSASHSLFEAGIVGLLGLAAAWNRPSRAVRASLASIGLLSSSAILVHLSGGFIEMHFHFFVMIPIIALYQSWAPFLLGIGYVALHHGVVGALDPRSVYNHPDAILHPWTWAGIHAVFVLAASAASLFAWRMSESAARAEAALVTQQLASERTASQLRTDLLRTAGHELNTPLTPLTLQVELLKAGRLGPLTPAQARAVNLLERNLDRLTDLIRDILDVTRLQEGRLPVVKEPTDLAELAREAAESFEGVAQAQRVALEARADGPLPVIADPTRLAQVLANLVGNALKFTPAGGRVSIEAGARGDEAVVAVRDTGIGFTAEQRARLFHPFSQVHPDAARAGSGLGLHICRGIVERHGGRIWAESEGPGHGATFGFALPLRAVAHPPDSGTSEGDARTPAMPPAS